MDSAKPDDLEHEGLSININSPCTNRIVGRDYIEVHLHLGDENGVEKSEDRENAGLNHDEVVERLVPKAVSIARNIQAAESDIQ